MAERVSSPGGAQFLGGRIAAARKRAGKTQGKIEEDTGVDRSVISRLEAGRFSTLNQSVQKVCTSLGIDPRNPDGDARLEGVLRRLTILSSRAPQLLTALEGVVDVLEAIGEAGRPEGSRTLGNEPP